MSNALSLSVPAAPVAKSDNIKSSAYLVRRFFMLDIGAGAASYQKLLDRVDQREALAGIKRGLADVKAGRVTPLKDFEKEFRKKHGVSSRPH